MVIDDQDGQIHRPIVSSKHSCVLSASPEVHLHARSDVVPQRLAYGCCDMAGPSSTGLQPDR